MYCYVKGENSIERAGSTLYLSESAKRTVDTAVASFEEKVELARNTFTKVSLPEICLNVLYKRVSDEKFDAMTEYGTDARNIKCDYHEAISIGLLILNILNIRSSLMFEIDSKFSSFFESKGKKINDNPLYRSAAENGDDLLCDQIKLYYRKANKKECSRLSKRLFRRILPSLIKEYDMPFYVEAKTIDLTLLSDSGYRILHRPYFAMQGSTHNVYELNPHTKKGVDAAPYNVDFISFDDYLELFE